MNTINIDSSFVTILITGFFLPQRYVLTLMGFCAFVVGYAMRLSLSVTITQMVQAPIYLNLTDKSNEPICPFEDYNYMHRNDIQAEQSYNSVSYKLDFINIRHNILFVVIVCVNKSHSTLVHGQLMR